MISNFRRGGFKIYALWTVFKTKKGLSKLSLDVIAAQYPWVIRENATRASSANRVSTNMLFKFWRQASKFTQQSKFFHSLLDTYSALEQYYNFFLVNPAFLCLAFQHESGYLIRPAVFISLFIKKYSIFLQGSLSDLRMHFWQKVCALHIFRLAKLFRVQIFFRCLLRLRSN